MLDFFGFNWLFLGIILKIFFDNLIMFNDGSFKIFYKFFFYLKNLMIVIVVVF